MMEEIEEPLLSKSPDLESHGEDIASITEESPALIMIPRNPDRMTKGRVLKNLWVLDFSLFVYYTGFTAISNLQSTMNSSKGIGVASQASIYAASMIACVLLPDLLVKTFGCKKIAVFAVICHIPYIASNFYPSWGTLIPSAILLGVAAAPLTSSQAYYTNEMARRYHLVCPEANFEVIVAKFYGLYSFFTENTQIWGNLISYYTLRPNMLPLLNHTTNMHCGVSFRKDVLNETNPNLHPPPADQRYLMVGIFICFGLASALMILVFVDALGNDVEHLEPSKRKCAAFATRVGAMLRQVAKPNQILLIPLSILCGLQTAFYTGDFTQAFIACSWGVHHVGFVTICFGVCGAFMAILVGPLVKCFTQMAVILWAALLNVILCALLFVWQPSPDVPWIYFVIAGVWGMTDAIWWSQVPALYGLMFPNDREAAFSNFYFWSFFGYFLSFSYSNFLTVAVKIYIMLVFLVIGIILYILGQTRIRLTSRTGYVTIVESQ